MSRYFVNYFNENHDKMSILVSLIFPHVTHPNKQVSTSKHYEAKHKDDKHR